MIKDSVDFIYPFEKKVQWITRNSYGINNIQFLYQPSKGIYSKILLASNSADKGKKTYSDLPQVKAKAKDTVSGSSPKGEASADVPKPQVKAKAEDAGSKSSPKGEASADVPKPQVKVKAKDAVSGSSPKGEASADVPKPQVKAKAEDAGSKSSPKGEASADVPKPQVKVKAKDAVSGSSPKGEASADVPKPQVKAKAKDAVSGSSPKGKVSSDLPNKPPNQLQQVQSNNSEAMPAAAVLENHHNIKAEQLPQEQYTPNTVTDSYAERIRPSAKNIFVGPEVTPQDRTPSSISHSAGYVENANELQMKEEKLQMVQPINTNRSVQVFYKRRCKSDQKDCDRGPVLTNIKSLIFDYSWGRRGYKRQDIESID